MDKAQVIHRFWAGFDIPAYDETTVPTGDNAPQFPYITYTVETDFIDSPVLLTGSVWYRSSSWSEVTAKVEAISQKLGYGGIIIQYDGGGLWLRRGSPFCIRMGDDSDNMVRRIYLNIDAEFISAE